VTFTCRTVLEHEVQRQAEYIGFVADPDTPLKVGKCSGVVEAVDGHLLQLQFEIEVLGKIPAHTGGHGVIITQ